jgi:peptidyl-prolyl cis-trans isomerase A (cyclophilin A)
MPRMAATLRIQLAWIVAATSLVVQAGAQTPATGITGTVRDASGKPMAGVAVSLGGQMLKAPQTLKTGADGSYRFDGIPNGTYTVSLRAPGFAPVNRPMVSVNNMEARVDVTMEVGGPPKLISFTTRSGTDTIGSALVPVRIQTPFGDIDILVDTKRAPITSANFLKYVDAGLYDGGRFNRATRPDNYNTAPPNRPMMELIQGGLSPDKKGQAFPAIPLERTSLTGLKHLRGVVSMARGGPDTATSEFFILLDDQPSLDFEGKRFDDNQGAAAFGYVIAGLDVVTKIQQQPVEGQNLSPTVKIVSIKRLPK